MFRDLDKASVEDFSSKGYYQYLLINFGNSKYILCKNYTVYLRNFKKNHIGKKYLMVQTYSRLKLNLFGW